MSHSPLAIRAAALALLAAGLAYTALRPDGPPAAVGRPAGVAAHGQVPAATLVFGGALDLNAAGATDLEALPGIGPAKAARILELRAARGGRFGSIDELADVPGIGPVTMGRLRPLVTVSRPGPVGRAGTP